MRKDHLNSLQKGLAGYYAARICTQFPVGSTYGRLTVTGHVKVEDGWAVICSCACGGVKQVRYPKQMVRGLVRSCGCLNSDLSSERIAARKRTAKPREVLSREETSIRAMLRAYRQSAAIRKIQFQLDRTAFVRLTRLPCSYCGASPTGMVYGPHPGAIKVNGIDRVDSSQPYTVKNCVPCCKQCNRAKRDQSAQDFIAWILKAARHLQKTGHARS